VGLNVIFGEVPKHMPGARGDSNWGHGAAVRCEKSGRLPLTAPSKVHNAGILLKVDANALFCTASKIVVCMMFYV